MDRIPVGVVGAGVMGSEIAQVFAAAGHEVSLIDVDPAGLERGLAHVSGICARRVKRGKMDQETADAIVARVSGFPSAEALASVQVVVEAVPEVMAIKEAVWAGIEANAPGDAILASNTSGLSISTLAALTSRPGNVLGMHFFNPASVMKLVEVIRGDGTDGGVFDRAVELVSSLGKTPVRVAECPGFLVNRILVRALAEAYRHADELGAGATSADVAVAEGPAPMGPYTLGDLIGIDTVHHIQKDLVEQYGDRFLAGTTLAATVDRGEFGQKSGTGFVVGKPEAPADEHGPAIAERYYLSAFDETCRCAEENVAELPDIDLAMVLGTGWSVGPLAWADGEGLESVRDRLEALGGNFAPRQILLDRISSGTPFIAS